MNTKRAQSAEWMNKQFAGIVVSIVVAVAIVFESIDLNTIQPITAAKNANRWRVNECMMVSIFNLSCHVWMSECECFRWHCNICGFGVVFVIGRFSLILQTICPLLGLCATDRKQCQEFVIIVTPWICSHFKAHTNALQFVDTVSPLFLTEQTMYYELHP